MTTDRTNSGVDGSGLTRAQRELADRYRQASGEVDERPSAAVRASILAAAAREVGARPIDAARPYSVRKRWPLAAAAAVMLSTLAVMMAIRTNEEMPQFSAPSAPARTSPDSMAPPAAATAPAASAAEQLTGEREKAQVNAQRAPARASADSAAPPAAPPPAPVPEEPISKRQMQDAQAVERPLERSQEGVGGRLKKESNSIAQAAREENRPVVTEAPSAAPANEQDRARQNMPASSPVPPPPPETTVTPKLRADQRAATGAAAPAPVDQTSAAGRDAAKPATQPPLAAAQSERKQVEESAALWLERIIKLRREGRHDEADAELKRFRERYPQVQPPAEALLPAGTR